MHWATLSSAFLRLIIYRDTRRKHAQGFVESRARTPVDFGHVGGRCRSNRPPHGVGVGSDLPRTPGPPQMGPPASRRPGRAGAAPQPGQASPRGLCCGPTSTPRSPRRRPRTPPTSAATTRATAPIGLPRTLPARDPAPGPMGGWVGRTAPPRGGVSRGRVQPCLPRSLSLGGGRVGF